MVSVVPSEWGAPRRRTRWLFRFGCSVYVVSLALLQGAYLSSLWLQMMIIVLGYSTSSVMKHLACGSCQRTLWVTYNYTTPHNLLL